MAGTVLDEFTTLMASQGPAWMRGPDVMINEGVKNTYTWPRMAAGKEMMEMVQGGDQITDTIFLQVKSTFERYNPNVDFDYDNNQTGTTWTVPWAFAKADVSWTKQELGLNKDVHQRYYRAQKYKSVMRQKHQNLWTDVCNAVDAEFWAVPDQVNMESATPTLPRKPYSIPVFVNEYENGDIPATGDSGGTAWSTVQGIDRGLAANAAWRPQGRAYTFDGTSAIGAAELFSPFSKLLKKVQFDRLPKYPEYSDKSSTPHFIGTQLEGVSNFEHAIRTNQDTFRGVGMTTGQDPHYDGPTFHTIPIQYISELDTAAIYPTADTSEGLSTYDDTGNTTPNVAGIDPGGDFVGFAGPRYYLLNGEYMKLVVHSENYAVLEPPIRPSRQPFSRVQVMDMWNNFVLRSGRRHGILYPGEAITSV